jgi:hypothetical protein
VRYHNIERQLGLHQDLDVIYVVDGYEAIITNEGGYPEQQYSGEGETIDGALADLDRVLGELPVGFSMKHAVVYP